MANHICNDGCQGNFDWFLTSDTVHTGFISGGTFKNKTVRYSVGACRRTIARDFASIGDF